jgi:protein TonB
MPADLFRPPVAATSSRRRVSLIPVSILVHAVAIGAFLIVPLLAEVELPPPAGAVSAPYIEVLPVAPPVALRHEPAPTRQVTNAPVDAAPIVAPEDVFPERDFESGRELVAGSEFGVDGGLEIVPPVPDPPPPPAPPTPRAPVPVGGMIEPPRKVKDVAPVYPAIAQSVRVQGRVLLEAVIGLDGRIDHLKVLRSVPLLDQAALDAVRQWVFTPTKLNGEPVQVVMTVTVEFRLN